ncbi:hypothetical protein [Janthinobacterium sp. 1_2014MBL_MicDiv]|uniref:hypothetical protein n=1 Tax=Janthinobacterium sp. 1_2014MBL_MicDiv TaxID=1644131 RepID=UPI0012EC5F77|nr:hypothetical protein [Janthinobacterium sp. 1_2014MBL_MicDiv]
MGHGLPAPIAILASAAACATRRAPGRRLIDDTGINAPLPTAGPEADGIAAPS